MDKIDFVIPWVDGKDKKWQAEKAQYYISKEGIDASENRYRDWNNLKYWFRGVEEYADWVHKIYFVTWGHIPKWLNVNHKKLVIVNHKDYIPKKYLPTFSANPIELNLHRIEGLNEKFVYFNDDMFITNKVDKFDFFKKELPIDRAIMTMLCSSNYYEQFNYILLNNAIVINQNFNKKIVLKKHFIKFFNFKYGKDNFNNIFSAFWKQFSSFQFSHLPQPFLKSTFEDIWENEKDILDKVCMNKFRSYNDVNQYLLRYWQCCKGKFIPGKKIGKYFIIGDDNLYESIILKKYKMICMNDVNLNIDFEKEKRRIILAFEQILPEKSKYEI